MSVLGKLRCAIGSHSCATNSDQNGIWGECIRCRRRFGCVDRATLRRYADIVQAPPAHLNRVEEEGGK